MNIENKETSLSSTINEQMVEISSGKIELRDDRTKQKWTVEINPFLIGKISSNTRIVF